MKKLSFPALLLILSLLNAAAGILFISLAPDRVAVHFNAAFEADRLGSPWNYLPCFMLPPFLALGLIFETRRRGQKARNRKPLTVTLTFAAALLAYIGWLMLLWCGRVSETGQKAEAPLFLLVCAPLGLMFVVFGNYLPTIGRNGTFGIKTPATLSSDYVWTQTHRVMGRIWLAIGISEIACAFADTFAKTQFLSLTWLLIGIVGECIALPFVTHHFKRKEYENLSNEQ